MKNILAIDVEDWYQNPEFSFPIDTWHTYESRVENNTHAVLELLNKYNTNATFFILGYVAERSPDLIKEIASNGHEIASHGYHHLIAYNLSKDEFENDLKKSVNILENLTGQKVKGYRAAAFSITDKSLWALDIIKKNGLLYDSSIYPFKNYLYGIPDFSRFLTSVETDHGKLLELPLSTIRLFGKNLPFGGGFLLRSLPLLLTKYCINKLNREGHPAIIYFHPREIDPKQPRVGDLAAKVNFIYYHNIETTENKIISLLNDYEFTTIQDYLNLNSKPVVKV